MLDSLETVFIKTLCFSISALAIAKSNANFTFDCIYIFFVQLVICVKLALVRKVSGHLVTQKTVKGKQEKLEQPIYKDGLSDEDLQSFQDQLAVAIAERFAYRDAEAAQKAGAKVGVENDTVNASLDALAA